jgi:hypothetical protein
VARLGKHWQQCSSIDNRDTKAQAADGHQAAAAALRHRFAGRAGRAQGPGFRQEKFLLEVTTLPWVTVGKVQVNCVRNPAAATVPGPAVGTGNLNDPLLP